MIDPTRTIRILMLEDSDFDAELEIRELRKAGLSFVWQQVKTREEYQKALMGYSPDLILVDYKLPDLNGEEAILLSKKNNPDVPTIVVTGAVGEDTAVGLFQAGASDFLLKERISGRLGPAVKRALEEASNRLARRLFEQEQAQIKRELEQLATHDPLTGCASRSLLLERLNTTLKAVDPKAPSAAFFSITLINFKQFNVIYGVLVADQILVEIARKLSILCQGQDLVGNFGGDRFFLLLHREKLESQLQKLLRSIKDCFIVPLRIRNVMIQVEASIGGVVLKNPSDTPAEVLAQCDEAMRKNSAPGETRISMVDESLIAELKHQIALDSDISEAVRNHQLFLHFQPIVSLTSGLIVGAEALLRFREKGGAILPAGEFMEALIRTTALALIDEEVVTNFFLTWGPAISPLLQAGKFRFSFNISPGVLANVGYGERMLKQIQKGGGKPTSFKLEILEEGLMPTNGTVRENLAVLTRAGVQISVDDFGMGYSNLLRLSRLAVHELKVPRLLLGGVLSGDSRLRAVLDAVLGIAKSLGLEVVAEGIEKKEEADYLRKIGCQYGQGYLFGKAMPLEDLLLLLEKQGK
jgi:diguanylate cyclase (GGDEF)-like protein